jgi:hypothetical protein
MGPWRDLRLRLPATDESTLEAFRCQLRNSAQLVRASGLIVGGALPLAECWLINRATASTTTPVTELVTLGIITAIHLCLLAIVHSADRPLSAFLLEFDQLARQLEAQELRLQQELASQEQRFMQQIAGLEAQLEESRAVVDLTSEAAATFRTAIEQAYISLAVLQGWESQPPDNLERAFEQVLEPWISARDSVFWFRDEAALYNVAVYLGSPDGALEVTYRAHDPRLAPANRSWQAGQGHVGVCYSQGDKLFTADATTEEAQRYIGVGIAEREEDFTYYRSMVSAPIMIDNTPRGVFIVTSSVPGQMEEEIHPPVAELIASLLAHAMEQLQERLSWQTRTYSPR